MSLSSTGILTIPGNAICVAKSVKLQDSKSITITENGNTTILPDLGYEGMSSVSVSVNTNFALSATGTFTGSATVISTNNLTFRPKLVIAMYKGKDPASSLYNYYPMVVAIFDNDGTLLKSMFGGVSSYSKVSSLVDIVTGTASAGGFSLTLPSGTQYAVDTSSSNKLFHAYA